MNFDHPEIIGPAFELIKEKDPELYNKMSACDWQIMTVMSADVDDPDPVLVKIILEYGPFEFLNWLDDFSKSLAITEISPNGGSLYHKTVINYVNLPAEASAGKIDSVKLLADTLAHEFIHANQYDRYNLPAMENEIPAYEEDVRFANETGDAELIKYAQMALVKVYTHEMDVK